MLLSSMRAHAPLSQPTVLEVEGGSGPVEGSWRDLRGASVPEGRRP